MSTVSWVTWETCENGHSVRQPQGVPSGRLSRWSFQTCSLPLSRSWLHDAWCECSLGTGLERGQPLHEVSHPPVRYTGNRIQDTSSIPCLHRRPCFLQPQSPQQLLCLVSQRRIRARHLLEIRHCQCPIALVVRFSHLPFCNGDIARGQLGRRYAILFAEREKLAMIVCSLGR